MDVIALKSVNGIFKSILSHFLLLEHSEWKWKPFDLYSDKQDL